MRFGHHEADEGGGGKGGYYDDLFSAEYKNDDPDSKNSQGTLEDIVGPILFEFV